MPIPTGWNELPADFRELVDTRSACRRGCGGWTRRSTALNAGAAESEAPRKTNPVSDQITLLKTAFGRG